MTMFLIGGGPDSQIDQGGGLDSVHDEFVACAKKHGTRVAVFLLGSEDEVGAYLPLYADPITSRWPEAQIEPVWLVVPDVDDDDKAQGDEDVPAGSTNAQGDEPSTDPAPITWPHEPDGLAGIVVAGGWTPGYLTALAPKRDLLARLVRRDIPYVGYSAGAAIAARHAYVGGWQQGTQQVAQEILSEGLEQVDVRDGLALISPLVLVHNDTWSADGLVISILEGGHTRIAVSIDERTALMVDPVTGRTSVLGRGRVRWFTREAAGVIVRTETAPPPPPPPPRPVPAPPPHH